MKKIHLSITLLFFVFTFSLLFLFEGCGKFKKDAEKNAWEKDMNRLIDKAIPKEKDKK